MATTESSTTCRETAFTISTIFFAVLCAILGVTLVCSLALIFKVHGEVALVKRRLLRKAENKVTGIPHCENTTGIYCNHISGQVMQTSTIHSSVQILLHYVHFPNGTLFIYTEDDAKNPKDGGTVQPDTEDDVKYAAISSTVQSDTEDDVKYAAISNTV